MTVCGIEIFLYGTYPRMVYMLVDVKEWISDPIIYALVLTLLFVYVGIKFGVERDRSGSS